MVKTKYVSLVAGGHGFIGTNLCLELLKRKHQVIAVDNLLTSNNDTIHCLSRSMESKNDFRLRVKYTDICDSMDWLKEVDDFDPDSIDYIFNLASPASPCHYRKYPMQTLRAGSIGTMNLLNVAKRYDATFLMASTSEVYGDPEVRPQPESYLGNVNPVGPRAVYDEAKRFSEAVTMESNRQGTDTRIARIFNTYGPHMLADDGRIIPNFIMQALRGEPLTIYGNGEQTRSLCHVSDTVKGLITLIESDYVNPVNIGNPREMKVIDIADKIIDMTGALNQKVHLELPVDDPKYRCPDISVAMTELNWSPDVALNEGLAGTIEYFRRTYIKS